MNLSLGTAQFGSAYGITNIYGLPSEQIIYNMLDLFFEAGYSFIDTAQQYGDAHKKIAKWYKNNFSISKMQINITTKICINNRQDVESFQENVINLCEELGIEKLYSILIHNSNILLEADYLNCLNDHFKILKQNGIVKKAGISVYTPQEVLILHNKVSEIDIIQCPINILDYRFLHNKFQEYCVAHNIEVHARSLFLQGLLLSSNLVSNKFNEDVTAMLDCYKNFLTNNNLSALEACCLFANKYQNKVDYWVVGFNSPKELKEFILQVSSAQPNSVITFDMFEKNMSYIDTRTWSNIKIC